MDGFELELELARGEAKRYVLTYRHYPRVKICRGPSKGCDGAKVDTCNECYCVDFDDPRTTAQIIADMERGNG
jgi:hypothetical protein